MSSPTVRLIVIAFAAFLVVSCSAMQTADKSGGEPAAKAEPSDVFTQYRQKVLGLADSEADRRDVAFPPNVHWGDEQGAKGGADTSPDNGEPKAPSDTATRPVVEPARPADSTPGDSRLAANSAAAVATPRAAQAALSRDALLAALRREVRAEESPMRAAVVNAALALADASPGEALDPADLQLISREQAVNVQRFHQLLVALSEELSNGDGRFDRQAALAHMRDALGPEALDITDLQLCTSVSNFGLYEPLSRNTFIAGRTAAVIVYSEVDHFHPQSVSDGHFEVRLSQEVVLYEEAGGLDVWREPAAAVVDRSRNKRRDFYIVQPITLPANLTVGRYQLKVTIRDEYGGTRAERAVPIEVVAGTGLTVDDRQLRPDDPVRKLLDRSRR